MKPSGSVKRFRNLFKNSLIWEALQSTLSAQAGRKARHPWGRVKENQSHKDKVGEMVR